MQIKGFKVELLKICWQSKTIIYSQVPYIHGSIPFKETVDARG